MNYEKIYYDLILKRKLHPSQGYTEKHHILPKCIFPEYKSFSKNPWNMVRLTAREHFIAHLLLAKMYPDTALVHAAHMMSNMSAYNSKDYSWLREQHAESLSEKFKGKRFYSEKSILALKSPERARKISESLKGKPKTKEHIENSSKARLGMKQSPESNIKRSIASTGSNNPMFGRTHDESAREKIRQANKQKTQCPHCAKVGGIAIMKRWHFDKCKEFTNV